MRTFLLWTTWLVTLAGCQSTDPCNPNPCGAGQTCKSTLVTCSSSPDLDRERFLSCLNDKDFCSGRRQSCEEFCAGWMGCSGALDINEAGVDSVNGTAVPESICTGELLEDGGSSAADGGGSAAPSAACLALTDAGTTLGYDAKVVSVAAALNAGERVTVTYDYQGTATDTPYLLTAYWSDGTDAGVSDAGDPRVILWERRADGQTESAAGGGCE